MFLEYFKKFYIDLNLSYSMPLTEGIRILCMVILLNAFEHKRKFYLRVGVHFLLLWLIEIFIKAIFYRYHWSMSVPSVLILAFYALLFGTHPLKYRILYSIYYFVIIFFSNAFVKSIGAMVCMGMGSVYEEWMANICLLTGKTVLFVGFVIMAKLTPLEKYDTITGYDFVSISILAAVTCIAYVIVDNVKDFTDGVLNPTETKQSLFIFAIGLLIYLLLFVSYHSCYIKAKERRGKALLEMQVDTVREQYEEQRVLMDLSKDNLEEMRRIRHDIRNQFSYMQLILEQGKYEELKKYFNELNDKVALPLSYSDCENRVIRDVLNMEINKLQGGAKIEYSVAVGNHIPIDDLDLTTILLNLLDNAIEGCERDSIRDAVILFAIREQDSYLFLSVSNPIADEQSVKARFETGTAKEDRRIHGMGKKIVAAIVEKHNGEINYEIKDRTFRVEVMLALQ